jgi:hypothetical protein
MDEQINTLQSKWRYWMAIGSCLVFLAFFFMDMRAWNPLVVSVVVHVAMIVPALCLSLSLRALIRERFKSNLVDGPAVALALSLLIHLLAQMTGELLYDRLLPLQTDFSHADWLEIVLAIVCLGGAYATGISLLMVGIRLGKLSSLHWGLRRPLVYAFFVCGLFMTSYSISVTLHSARVGTVFTALSIATFHLTDLTFVILCLLLAALFIWAVMWRAKRRPSG